jgi:TonB family protein
MPKITYSLLIALGVHLAVLGTGYFFIDKAPTTVFLDPKNTIDVQLGTQKKHLAKMNVSPKVHKTTDNFEENSSINEFLTNSSTGSPEGITEGSTSNFEGSAVNYTEPTYPKLAIKRGIQGQVRMRIQVSAAGLPQEIQVIESSGHEILDKAATSSASSWRFQSRGKIYFVEKNVLFHLRD